MPSNDIEMLIGAAIVKYPRRWSDATIVFALGTYNGEEDLEEFLDAVENQLAETPTDNRASFPSAADSGPRLRRK